MITEKVERAKNRRNNESQFKLQAITSQKRDMSQESETEKKVRLFELKADSKKNKEQEGKKDYKQSELRAISESCQRKERVCRKKE